MCVEHRGYFIQQSDYNNHIMIIKDERMVLHSQYEEKLTEKQLRGIVDGYLKYKISGDPADIYADISEDK